MSFRFFKIENDMFVIDNEEVRTIPEFKRLLERDRGTKGDIDGRKKYRAWKEFKYIDNIANIFSSCNQSGLNEKDAHNYAVKEADLEEDYKPDEEVKKAIDKFRKIQEDCLPSLKAVSNLIKNLKLSNTICERIGKNIEATLELDEVRRKEAATKGEPQNYAADIATTNALIEQLNGLTAIATKLPVTIETLTKLEDKLLKEQTGDNTARGGKQIGLRAEPKKK